MLLTPVYNSNGVKLVFSDDVSRVMNKGSFVSEEVFGLERRLVYLQFVNVQPVSKGWLFNIPGAFSPYLCELPFHGLLKLLCKPILTQSNLIKINS